MGDLQMESQSFKQNGNIDYMESFKNNNIN